MKKYNGSTWVDTTLRQYKTATADIEPTIYTDGTAITAYTIKGNTVQNGTPTPSNPIPVEGVGELDSGQYKIPISNGGVTTNIYLGSTQTVRQVKKLVLTGDENWTMNYYESVYRAKLLKSISALITNCISSHYKYEFVNADGNVFVNSNLTDFTICDNVNAVNETTWRAYLAAQYAAGTPVTVWYVLATAETAAVNEPLMKIDDYADTLSNAASIPTTEGANSITVDTTVQPSEFTATWTGWHDAEVKEKSENLFDKDNAERYEYGLGQNNTVGYSANAAMFCFEVEPNTNYSAKVYGTANTFLRLYRSDNTLIKPELQEIEYDSMVEQSSTQYPEVTINSGNCQYIWLQVGGNWYTTYGGDTIMLNAGSTALPYEPYWK